MELSQKDLQIAIDEPELMLSPSRINMDTFFEGAKNITPYSDQFRPKLKSTKSSDLFKKSKTPMPSLDFNSGNRRQIVYIGSFNNIRKVESPPDRQLLRTMTTPTSTLKSDKKFSFTPKGTLTSTRSSQMSQMYSSLNFFKTNCDKYKPLVIKTQSKAILYDNIDGIDEDIFGDEGEDLAFLTSVNIKDTRKPNPVIKRDSSLISKIEDNSGFNMPETHFASESPINELPTQTESNTKRNYNINRARSLKILQSQQNKLPLPSISEARAEIIKKQKPKIYISARNNTIQPTGRPKTYKEHLTRVLNREGVPVAQHGLTIKFSPKKDRIKGMMQVYLADYKLDKFQFNDSGYYDALYNRVKSKGPVPVTKQVENDNTES